MSNCKNDDKRILKASVLSITVCVMFILFAVFFAKIGEDYRRQEIFATAESTAETTPDNNTDEAEATVTAEQTLPPTATAEPSDDENVDDTEKPVSTATPESTKKPENTGDEAENTDEPTDTDEPSDSKNPDATDSTENPDLTENPDDTESAEPENTESLSPGLTNTPIIITPSPTLPALEEPFVSGNVVIDVEEGKQTSSGVPQTTSGSIDNDIDNLLELTPTPIGTVDDKGSFAVFFDAMVYVFIGCAILTAAYGVFMGVKLYLKKKTEKDTNNE